MCLIIDANVFSPFFNESDTQFRKIRQCLFKLRVRSEESATWTVGGTKYTTEIKKHTLAYKTLITLSGAGRVKRIDDQAVDAQELELLSMKLSSRNDEGILALAQLSGCRAIVTDDNGLIKDFKKFLKPSGRVVAGKKHLAVIRECCRKKS